MGSLQVEPIDFCWGRLLTVEETIAKWVAGGDEDGPASFIGTFYGAQIIAGEEGWEGDFRGEPRVLWLPRRKLLSACVRLEAGQ